MYFDYFEKDAVIVWSDLSVTSLLRDMRGYISFKEEHVRDLPFWLEFPSAPWILALPDFSFLSGVLAIFHSRSATSLSLVVHSKVRCLKIGSRVSVFTGSRQLTYIVRAEVNRRRRNTLCHFPFSLVPIRAKRQYTKVLHSLHIRN